MKVQKSLADIQKEIMLNVNTAEDWERLDKEVDKAMIEATDDEVQAFVDSGAGEALDMACSALREIRKNN